MERRGEMVEHCHRAILLGWVTTDFSDLAAIVAIVGGRAPNRFSCADEVGIVVIVEGVRLLMIGLVEWHPVARCPRGQTRDRPQHGQVAGLGLGGNDAVAGRRVGRGLERMHRRGGVVLEEGLERRRPGQSRCELAIRIQAGHLQSGVA